MYLGIDVGSTTVKVALIQPDTKEIVYSAYERHYAGQSEKVHDCLKDIFSRFPGQSFKVAFCGSGGRPLAGITGTPYIQEVLANSIAVRIFYPEAKVAVELGGQDAKIIFFNQDPASGRLKAGDMRMNGNCAGGTGAFIDEVAALLRTPVEQFDALAAQGTRVYDISGRCGVFAKTDIQPLLNQGALVQDIALSTFHAIAKQTIGGLAQGLEIKPPVIFEGGPLAFNPTLVKVFAERLDLKPGDSITPANSEIFIAYGAALSIDEMFTDHDKDFDSEAALHALSRFGETADGGENGRTVHYFETAQERGDFFTRHSATDIDAVYTDDALALLHGKTLRVYLGIDAGSTTSKFVLLDEEENLVDSFYSNNRGEPLEVVKQGLLDMHQKYTALNINLEIIAVGTTGYGELLFAKAFGADFHTVETVAHAAAAQKYVPGVTFILDIGGQDMKAISLSNDIITDITLNEACSSGCGSFLEAFAKTLHIPVGKIAESVFAAKAPAKLGSRCTVFMNSSIITEQKNGKQADDIMAGLCRSIIENVFTKVVRIASPAQLGDTIVVQGGTFKNAAVLRALEQYLEKKVVRAPYPGEMGAIGIALLAKREISEHGYTSPHGSAGHSRFAGFDALKNFSYTQEANNICPFCSNNCNRTTLRFSNGLTWMTGNRCERGELTGNPDDPATVQQAKKIAEMINAVPDMVKTRGELLFKDYGFSQLLAPNGITVGIPRVMDFWRNMPFWKVFWQALGFTIKLSKKSSKKLYDKGIQYVVSDTVCFPAKLVHGHIQDLIESKVDRIFFPQINRLPPDNGERFSTFTCPVLKAYPLPVKYSNNPEGRHNITFDDPIFHWLSDRDRNYQLCRYMRETFNISEKTSRAAIRQADAAQQEFERAMEEQGKAILEETERQGKFAVVISGRPYQYDELISHNLSRYFSSIGIPVLTLDSIPGLSGISLKKTRLDITNSSHARLLSGAIFAAGHKALEYVNIFSFGCGHDALYADETIRLMKEISGKSPLILKLDESDVAGPLRIRVRSFIETVTIRRKKEGLAARPLPDPYKVKYTKAHRRTKTILVPNVSRAFCLMISAVIKNSGARAEALPMGFSDAIAMGKKYVHNDICFPAQVCIGEAIVALKSGNYDVDTVAIGTGKIMCDCRLTNYMALTRKALDEAGFPHVPLVGTDMYDLRRAHPGIRFTPVMYARTLFGIILSETLEFLRRKIRPYELVKGETDRIVENGFIEIARGMEAGGVPKAQKVYEKIMRQMCEIKYDRSNPREVVCVLGEYFLVYHPGSNLEIERYIESNGFEVLLPRMQDIYRQLFVMHTISEMEGFNVRHSLFDTLYSRIGDRGIDFACARVDKIARQHPLYEDYVPLPELAKYSDPILHRSVMSGESFLIPAEILHNVKKGVRSFVILQPFGCLPNHICGRGVMKKIKEMHPDIQILPLDYDPDVSHANIENRIQMLIMNTRSAS